jgi:hypothetical protein
MCVACRVGMVGLTCSHQAGPQVRSRVRSLHDSQAAGAMPAARAASLAPRRARLCGLAEPPRRSPSRMCGPRATLACRSGDPWLVRDAPSGKQAEGQPTERLPKHPSPPSEPHENVPGFGVSPVGMEVEKATSAHACQALAISESGQVAFSVCLAWARQGPNREASGCWLRSHPVAWRTTGLGPRDELVL